MGQIFIHSFKAAGRYRNPAGTDKLQDTVKRPQLVIQRGDVFARPCHFHNGKDRIHLYDMCPETADYTRHIGSGLDFRCGNFVQSHFHFENFVIRKIVGLDDIQFLLYLLHDLFNHIGSRPTGNRVFMDTLNGGSRHIQALYVQLAAGKYCRYLIQYSCYVL